MSNYDDRCEFIIRNCTQATRVVAHLFAAHYLRQCIILLFIHVRVSENQRGSQVLYYNDADWLEIITHHTVSIIQYIILVNIFYKMFSKIF